jgi:hypothetical protein
VGETDMVGRKLGLTVLVGILEGEIEGPSDGFIDGIKLGLGLGAGLSVGDLDTRFDGVEEGRKLGLLVAVGKALGAIEIVGGGVGVKEGFGLGAGDSVGPCMKIFVVSPQQCLERSENSTATRIECIMLISVYCINLFFLKRRCSVCLGCSRLCLISSIL